MSKEEIRNMVTAWGLMSWVFASVEDYNSEKSPDQSIFCRRQSLLLFLDIA
jgi:hypothetical protein